MVTKELLCSIQNADVLTSPIIRLRRMLSLSADDLSEETCADVSAASGAGMSGLVASGGVTLQLQPHDVDLGVHWTCHRRRPCNRRRSLCLCSVALLLP